MWEEPRWVACPCNRPRDRAADAGVGREELSRFYLRAKRCGGSASREGHIIIAQLPRLVACHNRQLPPTLAVLRLEMENSYQLVGADVMRFGKLQGRKAVAIDISPRTLLPNRCCGCGIVTYHMGKVILKERGRQAPDATDWNRAGPALVLGLFAPLLKSILLGAALFKVGKKVGGEVSRQLSGETLPIPYCKECKRFGSPRPTRVDVEKNTIRLTVHPEFERCLREGKDCDPY